MSTQLYSLHVSCVDEMQYSLAIPAWSKPVCLKMHIPQSEVEYKVTRGRYYIRSYDLQALLEVMHITEPLQKWPVYNEVMQPSPPHAVGLHCKEIRPIVHMSARGQHDNHRWGD